MRRVHGGALPPAVGARPYAIRREQATAAKEAIAQRTSRLAAGRPGDPARRRDDDARGRAPPPGGAARDRDHEQPADRGRTRRASERRGRDAGRRARQGSRALVGAATVEGLRSVRADVLVLGVCSLHPEIGITVLELEESYVKRAMVANAAEVVAVSAADKLGSAGPYVVGSDRRADPLVTDALGATSISIRIAPAGSRSWWPDACAPARDRPVLLRRRPAARKLGGADPGSAASRRPDEPAARASHCSRRRSAR